MATSIPEEREKEKERPRLFGSKVRDACWQNADVVPGRHPERWRKDVAGNIVCKRFWGCLGCLCFQYDHIIPFSKGGETTAENCQILQSRVNRMKSDKQQIPRSDLEGFSCEVQFSDKELDIVEMAVYGDVVRPGNQCRCRTIAETLGRQKLKNSLAACELPYKEI
ncbi:HNH endonuclease domain-containing protein [Zostera marina]|uniref:HNH endonuclease domain-containing protein n=2 Tax=Zostera marina TaxID=29655 RepID=A0A0K9NXE2_ZOSMR|nr:HNH endonuclease domain-containing protein [Zostera marina]